MGRVNFGVELGFDIYDENGLILAAQIVGAGAPAAGAPFASQPIGSIYQRTNGEFYVKTANVDAPGDWALVPIVLSAGYLPANGDPTIGDSFEVAIEKLDANQDDIQTSSGLAQGAVSTGAFTGATLTDTTIKGNLQELETVHEEVDQNVNDLITLSGETENSTSHSAFTGTTIPDTSTTHAALQSLETSLEAISGGAEIQVTGLTVLADIDTFLVDDCQQIEWEVVAFEEATPANKKSFKVMALHNGAVADATLVDDTQFAKLKLGANYNLVMVVDLNGAAAAQTVRLRASSSTAGVTITVRRTIIA